MIGIGNTRKWVGSASIISNLQFVSHSMSYYGKRGYMQFNYPGIKGSKPCSCAGEC